MKVMTSNDLIIIEAINGLERKIVSLQEDMNKRLNNIQTEIQDVKYQEQLNTAKIEWLQHSIYWGFAFIGIIIALISIAPFRKEKSEKKTEWTERDLRSLIKEEISAAQLLTATAKLN